MIVDELNRLKVGYVPYSSDLTHPGDRRRFCYYAKKNNINFEIAVKDELYDIVILTEKADISFWSRTNSNTKIIFDFIDSYLALPYTDIKSLLRGPAKFLAGQNQFLKINYFRALKDMCSVSSAVVCTTNKQEENISNYCKNTHVVLDFHSAEVNYVKQNYEISDTVNIVWEGQPDNVENLKEISSALKKLSKKYDINLHVISDKSYGKYLGKYIRKETYKVAKKYFDNIFFHDWNIYTLSSLITAFDFAVVPINLNNPLARGKPENKLLLFWRMGMPVICSANEANINAMKKAQIKMYCSNENDWEKAIEDYILFENNRKKDAQAGMKVTEKYYSEEVLSNKWDKVFYSIL